MTIDFNLCYDFYLHNETRETIACLAPTYLFAAYLYYNLKKEQWNMMSGHERKISLREIFKKVGLEDIFGDDE